MKIQAQLDYNTILRNADHPVHLVIQLTAEELIQKRPEPVAFCVVLDRSGSMNGAPLQNAKKACQLIVRNLRPGDGFALVVFDGSAQVVIPFDKLRGTEPLLKRIEEIQSGGSTNLTAGWMLGRDELTKAPTEMRRRLLLLSDGQLNVGITDPELLGKIVGDGLEMERIRSSSIGFGERYDEKILSALAKVSGGNFHDADSPEKLPIIFQEELEGLKAITAQNVRLRVGALACCERWTQLSDYPQLLLPDGRTEIALGDLGSGEERALVLVLSVISFPDFIEPFLLQDGPLFRLEALWDEIGGSSVTSSNYSQFIRIAATQNPADVVLNESTVSWIAVQKAGKALMEASEDVRNKKVDSAKRKLLAALASISAFKLDEKTQDGIRVIQEFLSRLAEEGGFSAKTAKQAHFSAQYMSRPSTTMPFSTGTTYKPTFTRKMPTDERLRQMKQEEQNQKPKGSKVVPPRAIRLPNPPPPPAPPAQPESKEPEDPKGGA